MIGFGWQYTRAQRFSGELTTTQESLAQSQLDAALANALIEAQLGNAEIARQHASKFFSGLQRRVSTLGGEAPAEFRRVLQQRDAAITFLSRSDPESVAMLQRLYADFQAGMRHGAATP
ncbi:MAG: hypothetical protein ABI885_21620 [Gammaproteobacteria bacterium]